mgnify:CR=1 FL=1
MTAVLQGTHDNYKIDHFQKIMTASSDMTKTSIDSKTIASHRVIADHLRASSFLIAEGILPSNEGRGYVLRRILRRGMRHSHLLGSKNPIFYKLFGDIEYYDYNIFDEKQKKNGNMCYYCIKYTFIYNNGHKLY